MSTDFTKFLNNFNFHLKAIGGGTRSKFWFYVILVANLVYFHPLFTEFKNFDPLAQNWPICRGGWGLSGGHFEPF